MTQPAPPVIDRYQFPIDRSLYQYARFSDEEYARRHTMIRDYMSRAGLDCLLIAGGSVVLDRCWTNIRYVTNFIGSMEMHNYCVFPLRGDPTVVVMTSSGMMPDMVARSVVDDVRYSGPAYVAPTVVRRLHELGYERAKIGIVELDRYTSIPLNHHRTFTEAFPKAEFRMVTSDWWNLRMIKSPEEIEALEEASRIGDLAIEAVKNGVHPGMTEADLFALLYTSIYGNGGEHPSMVLAVTSPMTNPISGQPRNRPIHRTLERGDIIGAKLGPRDERGYESQIARPLTLGPATDEYKRMFELAVDAHERVAEALKPGKSSGDVLEAAAVIKRAGFDTQSPPTSGIHGGLPYDGGPIIGKELWPDEEITFMPGMVTVVNISLVAPDRKKGLYVGSCFVTTEDGVRCLHKSPLTMAEI